jgi:chromosome segregation ATPase
MLDVLTEEEQWVAVQQKRVPRVRPTAGVDRRIHSSCCLREVTMRTKVLLLAGVFVVGAVALSGQAQRPPATLDDLLTEIRGLRADLRQTTRATTQMQLLTARLQLQEQRIAVLSNQRNDVPARLATETRLRADAERQVQTFEDTMSRNEDLGVPRKELEAQQTFFKQVFTQHRDAEQQLRAQDSQLSSEIANEQNRWEEFNNRLDGLERSLK